MIMQGKPKISVIVPVYNAHKTLPLCLDSLMALDFPKEDREIIVVDNNSTDGSKEIIRQYPVHYLFEAKKGRASARNRGVRSAGADLIAFIDADCIASRDWLKILFEAIQQGDAAICGGEIIAYKQETIFERYAEKKRLLNQKKGISEESSSDLPRVVTANAVCRKEVIEGVGYFDENLVTSEDTDLSWRAALSGYKIKYIPEAIVYHQHIATLRKFWRHHFEYGTANAVLSQKYNMGWANSKKPGSMLGSLFLTARVSLTVVYDILRFISSKFGKDKPSMLFLHAIRLVAYNAGTFSVFIKRILSEDKHMINHTVSLDYANTTLTIRNNGTKWLLRTPTAWIADSDSVKLVAFLDKFYTFQLNKTASRVWQSLLKTRDLRETKEELSRCYNIPAGTACRDVDEFMETLANEGIFSKTNN